MGTHSFFNFTVIQVVMTSNANLTTTLKCENSGGCGYLPDSGFRSTLGLLLATLVPVLAAATQSVYMKPLSRFSKRCLDIVLWVFFPEIGLWKVQMEEAHRSRVLRVLRSEGIKGATRQQLMAIQAGRLYRSNDLTTLVVSADRDNWSQFQWCSEEPELAVRLEVDDIAAYAGLLKGLPTGRRTWEGIGLPDFALVILTLQWVWLITTIAVRLTRGYWVSLVELYSLYCLAAFISERLLTVLNKPAWDQHCVSVRLTPPVVPPHTNACGVRTASELGVVVPVLLFLAFPAYMLVYGYFMGQGAAEREIGQITPPLCFAAGAMYGSAAIWGLIGIIVASKFEGSWLYFLRWIPWGISIGAIIASKLIVFTMGIAQVFLMADPEIYRVPPQTFTLPHIG
ncbi:hypothetical protein L873DRAFT_1792297 [Choiromyces venosus 120613-1]|uniref:Uncharacterized protein n=1 Tax=Choiromyces venosus 120613-1 TaxID=1336337 RepID=A0A3N4JG88_9PEZI|nr:hypothetical protein L873DRAFT_1792297 [Choiromyces venosus 120613-1]